MKLQNQILCNLNKKINEDAKDDWYYICNDAEQALFKVKEMCHDERAINALERMILELNNIRMEQYSALTEYAWEDKMDLPEGYDQEVYDAYFSDIAQLDLVEDEQPDFITWLEDKQNELVDHVKSIYKDKFHIEGSDGTEYKTDEELKQFMYSVILDYGSYLKYNNMEAKDYSLIDHFDEMNGEYSMWEVIADDKLNESSIEVENGELKGQTKKDMEDFVKECINTGEVVTNINTFAKILKDGGYTTKNREELVNLFNYYKELCNELKESALPEVDNDPDLNAEQVQADVDHWTDTDEANTEDVSGREPVGVYAVSNNSAIFVYEIKNDIDDMVLAGDSSDTSKAMWKYINYEDLTDEETGETIPFFWYGDIKVPMNEVMRTNLNESTVEVDMTVKGHSWEEIEMNIRNLLRYHKLTDKIQFRVKEYEGPGGWPTVHLTGDESAIKDALQKLGYEEGSYQLVESVEVPNFQDILNKELTVKEFDIDNTGGNVYVAWGSFEEYPLFFTASSDGIAIYDADEREAMKSDDYDGYEWENAHSISGASYTLGSPNSTLYKSVITQMYDRYTTEHPNTAYINNMDLFSYNNEFLNLKEDVEVKEDPMKELAKKYYDYTTTISITEDEWFSYLDSVYPEFKDMDRTQAVEFATNLLLDDLKNNKEAVRTQIENDLSAYSEDSGEYKDIMNFINLLKDNGINLTLKEDSYDDGPSSREDGAYFKNDERNDVWITGWYVKDGKGYYVNAKVYMEPSEYGINNGPVSKFSISDEKDNLILNYDRSWDVRPAPEYKEVYREILKAVKQFRKENPYE